MALSATRVISHFIYHDTRRLVYWDSVTSHDVVSDHGPAAYAPSMIVVTRHRTRAAARAQNRVRTPAPGRTPSVPRPRPLLTITITITIGLDLTRLTASVFACRPGRTSYSSTPARSATYLSTIHESPTIRVPVYLASAVSPGARSGVDTTGTHLQYSVRTTHLRRDRCDTIDHPSAPAHTRTTQSDGGPASACVRACTVPARAGHAEDDADADTDTDERRRCWEGRRSVLVWRPHEHRRRAVLPPHAIRAITSIKDHRRCLRSVLR